MTTDLLKLNCFAEDVLNPCAYAYDAYALMTNRHTDADGSAIYPADLSTIALWRRWKRLRAGGGFFIDKSGHGPYSCVADTTAWYVYDYDVSRWLSRDPVGEKGFELLRSATSRNRLMGNQTQRLVSFLERHGYSPAEIQEILKGIEYSGGNTALLNLYAFVWNSPLNAVDPLGDMPEWLKNFLEWLKTVAGYACPSPGGELAGALECGPGLYEIAAREKLRHELINALIAGDDAKADEIQKKINELDQKLQDNAKDCLKKKCCKP